MREYNKAQSKLIGALIGLCRSLDESNSTKEAFETMAHGVLLIDSEDTEAVIKETDKVHAAKHVAVPDCSTCMNPCGRTDDYNIEELDKLDPKLKKLKLEILKFLPLYSKQVLLQDMESYQVPLMTLMEGLFSVGYDFFDEDELREKIEKLK